MRDRTSSSSSSSSLLFTQDAFCKVETIFPWEDDYIIVENHSETPIFVTVKRQGIALVSGILDVVAQASSKLFSGKATAKAEFDDIGRDHEQTARIPGGAVEKFLISGSVAMVSIVRNGDISTRKEKIVHSGWKWIVWPLSPPSAGNDNVSEVADVPESANDLEEEEGSTADSSCPAASKEPKEKPSGPWRKFKETVKENPRTSLVVGAVAGSAVALAAVPLALGAAGFGAAGVVAGSGAAALQASIELTRLLGKVAAGSLFAMAQSAGAVGLGAAGTAVTGATGALAGVAGTAGVQRLTKSKQEQEKKK